MRLSSEDAGGNRMEVTEWRSQERVRSSKGLQEALPKRRPYKRALQKGPPKRL